MILIVGGGVVGLHVAAAICARPNHSEIFLLEKGEFLGDETSGRNSQVIHAGFAYPVGSFKARLCLEGNRLSYEWLKKLNVPHAQCGKWIVAFNRDDIPALGKVLAIGAACGVPGMREASAAEVAKAEPSANKFAGAIFSATSGMMDAAEYVRALERYLLAQENCNILYPCAVTAIDPVKKVATTTRGDIEYETLINCAGLFSDDIYQMCGGTRKFRIKPFKGEYYVWKTGKVRSVLYPVPRRYLPGGETDKRLVSSMGIHLHRDMGDQLFVGPTQVELDWDKKTDYSFATPKEEFVRHAAMYAPVDSAENFEQAYAGNRPKLYEDGHPVGDFQIFRDGDHIHLLGIESPGLTAAPAIGKMVANMI